MGTFNWIGPKNIFSPFSLSKKWKSTNFSPFLTFFPLSVTFFLLMIQTFPICHLKGLTNACQYIWSKKYILLKKNSKIRQLRFSNFNLLSMLRHCAQECLRIWEAHKQSKEVTLLNLLMFYFTTQDRVDNKCVYCTTRIRMI